MVSGVIINSNNGNLIERFTRYLSTQSGYPLQAMYVNKYAELSRVLRDDPKAVGWTCGAPFVEDYDTTGQQLVAVPLFNKKPTSALLDMDDNAEGKKLLSEFYLDGFVEKTAAFYQPIKDMLNEVNIDTRK